MTTFTWIGIAAVLLALGLVLSGYRRSPSAQSRAILSGVALLAVAMIVGALPELLDVTDEPTRNVAGLAGLALTIAGVSRIIRARRHRT